jgi:phage shock protein E
MKLILPAILASLVIAVIAGPPRIQYQTSAPSIPNGKIDYPKFVEIALNTEHLREQRRLTEEQFAKAAAEPGVVVLDARSADKFALRHIKGAISLPFTDFTAESLAKALPKKDTKVLIYCNNNFEGDQRAFASKSAPASLNISTYIALTTYGYTNVWELGPLLDVSTTRLTFEGAAVK